MQNSRKISQRIRGGTVLCFGKEPIPPDQKCFLLFFLFFLVFFKTASRLADQVGDGSDL